MKVEKRVAILVSIAIVLAIIAISLNYFDNSSDLGTNIQKDVGTKPVTGAVVGLSIGENPDIVEDKGNYLSEGEGN